MNMNRICPDCKTEYLPHIEKCADCGSKLLLPGEHKTVQEKKKRLMEQAVENEVVVREGDLRWMDELYNVLIDAGIPCTIHTDAGCNKSCCGDKCRLTVSKEDHQRAQSRIEEYFMEMHPELRTSRELLGEGKCPACGFPAAPDCRECPDCGLVFGIIEEGEG